MKNYRSLNHTRWDCKYHVVFIPKRRKKQIYGVLRKHLGEVFHALARQKECRIEEGHLHLDHVHMCISIPPKYAVKQYVRNQESEDERLEQLKLTHTEKSPSGDS